MRAIRLHSFGGPEVLGIEDVPEPEAGEGEVRIKVAAAGVNFMDIYGRKGQGAYAGRLPTGLGGEAAGVIDQVGPGVTGPRVGDHVASPSAPGAYAEYVVVPAARVVKVPAGVDLTTAGALMLQGLTAHFLASSTYPLKDGDTALVHAGAGGVGRLLVQIAKRRGARVLATVSTDEKERLARSAGADEVIRYTATDFADAARRLTGGRGVDVVYDSVGKDTFDKSLDSLRPRGYMVLYGQSSGPVPPVDPQVLNAKGSLFLTRPTIGHHIATPEELRGRTDDLFGLIASGGLDVRVAREFPLGEAADAHRLLESRQALGKILLIPG
ncbi:MAG TPA: quinone oxidoreductase [Ktedonobacterales bacterium]